MLIKLTIADGEIDCGACCTPLWAGHWAVLDEGEGFCSRTCRDAKRAQQLRALLSEESLGVLRADETR
jgi:hypothetical protein